MLAAEIANLASVDIAWIAYSNPDVCRVEVTTDSLHRAWASRVEFIDWEKVNVVLPEVLPVCIADTLNVDGDARGRIRIRLKEVYAATHA